jgi:hypothetical protein
MKYIQCIQINLGDLDITQDTDIGLYNESGTNYLRWSEFPVSGDTVSWTSGLVSIGGYRISSDLRLGGNKASSTGYTVVIPNTSQLFQAYEDLDFSITGKTILLYELRGTDADADATDRTLLNTMVVSDSTWTEQEWTIQVRNGQRDANISSIVNNGDNGNFLYADGETNGKTIPVTLGKFLPEITDSGVIEKPTLAKFIRTDNSIVEDFFNDNYLASVAEGVGYTTYIFPIVDTTITYRRYKFEIRTSPTADINLSGTDLDNTYVRVVDGQGVSQIRKVLTLDVTTGDKEVLFEIEDCFTTDLEDGAVDPNVRSWVQIVKVYRRFDADVWPCHSFRNSDGNSIASAAELYVFEDEKFKRVAPYGYDFIPISDNNAFSIDASLFSSTDFDEQNSFIMLPVGDGELLTDATLEDWLETAQDYGGADDTIDGDQFLKHTVEDGLYGIQAFNALDFSFSVSNLDYINDKNGDNHADIQLQNIVTGTEFTYATVVKFPLPELPSNITFSDILIGVKTKDYEVQSNDPGNVDCKTTVKVVLKKFKYSSKQCTLIANADQTIIAYGTPDAELIAENIPDFYYESGAPSLDDNYCFYVTTGEAADDPVKYGKENSVFSTGISNKVEYESYVECAIIVIKTILNTSGSAVTPIDLSRHYELALILTNSNTIRKQLYTPFYGRIFNDTWGGRVTAADHIENPVDTLEHIKRLERYGDNEAGKEYSSSALIKTSGDGSFDDTGLNYLRGYDSSSFALQLEDENACTISNIEKILCRDYSLLSYYDNNGYACIKTFEAESPAETIGYGDIIEGSEVVVIPPSPDDVFCQPKIKYCYNNATGEYDRTLEVKNVHLDTYDADICTSGIDASEAESIWTTCRELYLKYGVINEAPSIWSNLRSVSQPLVAIQCLIYKLNAMAMSRVKIRVYYEKARLYHIFQHISFNHPHITDGSTVECIIEEIAPDKNKNYVSLLLLTDTIAPLLMAGAWQNTYDISNPLYQDTYENSNDRYQGIT